MSNKANKTMNPDHPDHPKNVAARAHGVAAVAAPGESSENPTTESTEVQDTKSETVPGATPDFNESNLSASEQAALQAKRQLENPLHAAAEKTKTITKEELFVECLTFVSDFANAGNLTGRAMLLYCERAQLIINRYNVAKAVEKKKKVTKK